MAKSDNVEICSKQAGIKAISLYPRYTYEFKEADKPVDVSVKHVKKLLRNPTFYEVSSAKKKKVSK